MIAQRLPHIVIVGAGFGGLTLARKLRNAPVNITLIDRQNYHLFQPLLYQVAIAGLLPSQIAYPLRTIFRKQKNLTFQMGEATSIDFDARFVKANGSVIAYDYLILAVGGQTNFFGLNSVKENGFQLKDIQSAVSTRNHLLKMFEQASREADADKRRALLTFVVVGGGPTGVETAGALAELIIHVLAKDYPLMDMKDARVLLLEAGNSVMAAYPDELRKATFDLLRSKNVEIMLDTKLTDYNGQRVTLGDGGLIPTHTVIWTAGVRAAELADRIGVEQAGSGADPSRGHFAVARSSRSLRSRRRGVPRKWEWSTVADAVNGRHPAGKCHRAEHPADQQGRKSRTVPLQGPGPARDHRAQRGGGAHLGTIVQRVHRLGDLGVPAHLPPDRVPQPVIGIDQLGMGIFLLREPGAPDHEGMMPGNCVSAYAEHNPNALTRKCRRMPGHTEFDL
jgi:NADH dehydrogenase FAD-containing subunit